MNKIKQVCALLLLLIGVASMTACESEPFQYTFRQDRSNIEKVEICGAFDYDQGKPMDPLVNLTEDEIDAALSYLSSLDCWEPSVYDHTRDFGVIMICIKYLDGEIEIIGVSNNGWVTPNGDWNLSRSLFMYTDLKEIYFKYLDAATLAKLEIYP